MINKNLSLPFDNMPSHIVSNMLGILKSRRGFSDWWDDIDEIDRSEMIICMEDFITKLMQDLQFKK